MYLIAKPLSILLVLAGVVVLILGLIGSGINWLWVGILFGVAVVLWVAFVLPTDRKAKDLNQKYGA